MSQGKVASMRDAVAELVRDGDTLAIEGFTHLISFAAGHEVIRQGRRDLTLCRLTPDGVYDQMIGAGVAGKLVFSWMGNPGGGAPARPPGGGRAPRPRAPGAGGVQPLRDGRALCRRGGQPALLAAAVLLRDRPAPGQPQHPAGRLPVRGRAGVRRAAPAPGRGHRPRPAGRRRRQHPGLGADRLPEGGGVRGQPGDRGRRGAGRRRGRAGRPQPDPDPGDQGGRGGRLPARRPPLLRPGLLRTRQPGLAGGGPNPPRLRGVDGVAGRVGPRDEGSRRIRGEARGRALGRADPGPGPVRGGRLRGLPLMASWSKSEMLVVAGARALEGRRVCFVGIGLPNIAVALAQRTVAPDIELIYESGVYGARPARLPLSIGDPCLVTGATAAMSMVELFSYYLQGGLVDVGFLGAAQLDRFGNINTTVIGDYQRPKVRLPGSGGACEIAINAREVFVLMRQSARSFVDRIDFRTS